MEDGKVAVFTCNCNNQIGGNIDFDELETEIKSAPNVIVVKRHDSLCTKEGQEFLENEIKTSGADRVLIVGCTPRTYEEIMIKGALEAGINRYLIEMINIREQCDWVHEDRVTATNKAKVLVLGGIAKVNLAQPVGEEEMQLKNNNDILIIGGGVAGITAALELLKHGINVHIVERTAKIGGRAFELDPERLVEEGITLPNIDDLTSNENAEILLESEVEDIQGTFGNYHIKIKTHEEESQKELDVGAIIIASGSELFNAKEVPEYSYQDEDVIDFFELDKMLANKELQVPSSGQVPKSVNFLQCVGSRDETKGNRHCSLLCCTYAIKQAIKIKNLSPGTEVYIHYMDLRGPDNGFEETYLDAQKKGVNFLRGRVAEVQRNDGNLKLRTELIEFGDVTDLKSDLVVLAVGQQAAKGTAKLANMIHLPLDIDGFLGYYNNRYDIIDRRGISIAGCAQGPRGIRQSILDAKKSSSEIATIMKSGFKPKTVHSIIDEARCKGCRLCEELCPYDAISMKTIEDYITEEVRLVSSVNLAACQGCGACAMVCPGGVPELVGFAFEEILAQIDEVI